MLKEQAAAVWLKREDNHGTAEHVGACSSEEGLADKVESWQLYNHMHVAAYILWSKLKETSIGILISK